MLCRSCLRAGAISTITATATRITYRALWPSTSGQGPTGISSAHSMNSIASPRRLSLLLQHSKLPFSSLKRQQPLSRQLNYSSTAALASSPPVNTSGTIPPQALEKPPSLDAAESQIWDRLTAAFAPAELVVRDVSGGCGSMYLIEIAAERFHGMGVLAQQRAVNAVLKDLMGGWHGVQLKTRVP